MEIMTWLGTPISGASEHVIASRVSYHGRMMTLAWGVLVPAAVVIARYFKITPRQHWPRVLDNQFWWHSHRMLNYSAVLTTFLAIFLLWGHRDHAGISRELHAWMGWSLCLLGLIQIIGAQLRGTKGGPTASRRAANGEVIDWHGDHYDMTTRRIRFERIHKSWGYAALLWAMITIVMGLWSADAPRWIGLALMAWWCALLILVARLQSMGYCIDTYQAIWGNDPAHPGAAIQPIGWGIRQIPPAAWAAQENHKANFSMNDISIDDPRLVPVVRGAHLQKLCSGALWGEGPVWLYEDDAVLWSDIPNNRILRWSDRDGMTVWRQAAQFTNGHTRDLNGDLLHCSHGLRAIVRTRATDGGLHAATADEIVIDRFNGKRLNSPNDVVVRSDGTIWFTDPPYGILSDKEGHRAPQEQAANHVFCYDPGAGQLIAATAAVQEPNGLAFSPDESILYVSDTSAALRADGRGHHRIVAFDVNGTTLSAMRVIANVRPGLPDGFRLDSHGWIYTSSENAVQIFSADGALLGKIAVPEKVGNLTFGGRNRDQLYIVATTSLYRITLNTQGIQRP